MLFRSPVVGVVAALLLSPSCSAKPLVLNEATGVSYLGSVVNGVEHYRNIKYALDTSGTRRFAPPVPYHPPRDAVIDASARGPGCPQLHDGVPPFFSAEPDLSEDCLSVHIARSARGNVSSKSKLPVLVWLYGGGIVKGSAYDEHSDPDKLIKLAEENGQPVIYVAINSRLGIFGFACSDSLKEEKSMNAGMRDQRAGFEWIRDNVAAFGGDPDRITAFGLSAGGTFISLHHLAYGGEKGLPFQQAYMMSGPHFAPMSSSRDDTNTHTKNVAIELGCKTSNDEAMISCLRDVPMEKLRDVAWKYCMDYHPPLGLYTFLPSVDGDILPDQPARMLHQGRFVKGIPSILAWTEDDGAMSVGPGHLINNEADMEGPLNIFASYLTDAERMHLFSLYPVEDFEDDVKSYESRKAVDDPSVSPHYFRLSRILRDIIFTCKSFDFTYQMVRHTRASGDPTFSNVRHYTLNQSMLTSIWANAGMPYVQVSHGSDQNYIFNGLFIEDEVSEPDQILSRRFSSSIINFAATGDPVSRSAASSTFDEWPVAYSSVGGEDAIMASNFNLLVIGGPYGTTPVSLSQSRGSPGSVFGKDSLLEGADSAFGKAQKVLVDTLGYGDMSSHKAAQAKQVIEQQKLFTRCAYINELSTLRD